METMEQRAERIVKRYPFMDEVYVEDIFKVFNRVGGDIDLIRASELLEDFFLDVDELKGLVRLWNESSPGYVPEEVETDKVEIAGEKFSFIVVAFESNTWAKADSIDEAKDKVNETLCYFYDFESKRYAIYLVNEETKIDSAGSFVRPKDTTAPMRIK